MQQQKCLDLDMATRGGLSVCSLGRVRHGRRREGRNGGKVRGELKKEK